MGEKCPKCGSEPKHAWLCSVLEGKTVIVKLPLEEAHKLYNKTNKEFQGNLNAAMKKAIELLTKHYGGTTKPPHIGNASLGYECSKCGYLWKTGEGSSNRIDKFLTN